MTKAIVFDLDGTLVDSSRCAIEATHDAFAELSLPPPTAETTLHYMGIPIERSFREMGADALNDEQFSELLSRFRARYKELVPRCVEKFDGMPELLQSNFWRYRELFYPICSEAEADLHRFAEVWGYLELFVCRKL